MGRLTALALALAALLPWMAVGALAQQKPLSQQVVGTWSLVSGSQIGPDANGLLVLDSSGHMTMQIVRPGRAKFASNSRIRGTAEENQGAVHGMISYFGRYTVDEATKTITYRIERSSYPNWDGTEQKRPFTVTADELRYTNAAPSSGGAPAQLIWKRVN